MEHISTPKQRKTEKVIAWLQIGLGIFFLCLAVYKFVTHGYSFESVNIRITIVFSLIIPAIAISRLVMIRKKEKTSDRESR